MMTELQDWCGLSYTEDIVLGEEEVGFHVGQAVGREQSIFSAGHFKLNSYQ